MPLSMNSGSRNWNAFSSISSAAAIKNICPKDIIDRSLFIVRLVPSYVCLICIDTNPAVPSTIIIDAGLRIAST